MDQHECGAEPVSFAVPDEYRALVPGEEAGVAFCPECLSLLPESDPDSNPSFEHIHPSFPQDPDAAIPMALLLGLLDELALYRSEVATLLEAVEQAGVDPLLVLSRLAADPDIDPSVDLDARRHQLEQLL